MADEDYGEDVGFFFDDDDYLYVEDEYAIADELAENQCPSPGYAGTNNELAMESFEYDIYEYFGELEYGTDEYWDATMRPMKDREQPDQASSKRKRGEKAKLAGQPNKKRKTLANKNAAGNELENVVYMPFAARLPPTPPKSNRKQTFALLPDWKERFAEDEEAEKPSQKPMPAEMRRAAEGTDGDFETSPKSKAMLSGRGAAGDEAEEEWEDEDEDGGQTSGLAGLDPAMLQSILKQKLQDSGLGEMDEGMFSQAIASMLSGSADDAAGDLANLLLGKANEGGDSALSGWLSQQGVNMEEDDNDNESTANEGVSGEDRTSQPDSAVGIGAQKPPSLHGEGDADEASESDTANAVAAASNARASGGAATPSAGVQTRKRKANDSQGVGEDSRQLAKRRQPSSAMPPSAGEQGEASSAAGRPTRRAVGVRGKK